MGYGWEEKKVMCAFFDTLYFERWQRALAFIFYGC